MSKRINGLNRVSYYVYELKENDQIAKSNRLQYLVDMFTGDQCIPEFNYIRALEFLIVFKQSDKEVKISQLKHINKKFNKQNQFPLLKSLLFLQVFIFHYLIIRHKMTPNVKQ